MCDVLLRCIHHSCWQVRLRASSGKIPQHDAGFVQAAQHLQDLVVEMRAAVLESRKSLDSDMKSEVLAFAQFFVMYSEFIHGVFLYALSCADRALLLRCVCTCVYARFGVGLREHVR